MTLAYADFIENKSQVGGMSGFPPLWMPDCLFDFQSHMVDWAVRKGRGALLESCGLGKTLQELVFADNVVRKTNRPFLLATPLSVSPQTVREGEKFGVECHHSRDGRFPAGARVVVTNYERLHYFNPAGFAGFGLDESGCIKNFDAKRSATVTEFARRMDYRLLCTATPAPNDYIELGTSAEALGELGRMDMLARFFKNDTNTLHIHGTKHQDFFRQKWHFKAHAERHFWRWVCSWARACRMPSDLGFDDGRFVLPELVIRETVVKAARPAEGMLFEVPADTFDEQREEAKRTLPERCAKAAEIVKGHDRSIVWCNLNPEGDLLAKVIPNARQVGGSTPEEEREEIIAWFTEPGASDDRVLVTKAKVFGFGLNLQCCAHMVYFPSFSFEEFHQAVRRCWRFGQTRPVEVDIVTTEGGAGILAALQRKARAAEEMFANLVSMMNQSLRIGRTAYGDTEVELPRWL